MNSVIFRFGLLTQKFFVLICFKCFRFYLEIDFEDLADCAFSGNEYLKFFVCMIEVFFNTFPFQDLGPFEAGGEGKDVLDILKKAMWQFFNEDCLWFPFGFTFDA